MRTTVFALCLMGSVAVQGAEFESAHLGAAGFDGKTLRVTGTWSGTRIEAGRLQLREVGDDPSKGQVAGRVETVDTADRRMRIGPVTVHWNDATQFKEISPDQLRPDQSVRVSVRWDGEKLTALSVQSASALPKGTLQLTGVVSQSTERADGFSLLGRHIDSRQPGYNRLDSLTQRQDSRRPEQPFGFDLFGRRATVTGEYVLSLRDRDNLRLDGRSKVRDLDHELKLEFFYPLTSDAWLFLSGKGVYEGEIYRAGGNTTSTRYIARDQTWLYFDRLGGTGLSLQAGRLNLAETREWWWDDDLDGLRLMHDLGPLHAEITLARELLRERSDEPDIDPEQAGVTRWAGRLSWLWAPRQSLDAFVLHTRDRSATPGVGATVPTWQEDGSDLQATWAGLRLLGDRSFGDLGDLRYWADAAWLRGRETSTEYDDDDGVSTVEELHSARLRGRAYDVGLSWESRLPARPALTLGHAWASGDGVSGDDIDHSFRQTGLHNNKWRYHGVNRFRYYGELLRPELSNLAISTIGLGLSLGEARSVDLIYHRYRQDKASRNLRDARVSASLNGTSTDIGEAVDLVFGSRQWSRVDLALTGSLFRAGDAYGSKAGTRAWQVLLEITVNF